MPLSTTIKLEHRTEYNLEINLKKIIVWDEEKKNNFKENIVKTEEENNSWTELKNNIQNNLSWKDIKFSKERKSKPWWNEVCYRNYRKMEK